MKYLNFYYEDYKNNLNLTDKIILSVISSVGDYSLSYEQLSHFTKVSIQNVKLSLKKLKKDNFIQGEKVLTVIEKPIGKYFKLQIDSELSIKENMIISFIKSTPNQAYYGSLQTLSHVLTLSVSTVVIGLKSLVEKEKIQKDKYNKCYKYSIINSPSEEIEEIIDVENVITEEQQQQDNEELQQLKVELEALKVENEQLKVEVEKRDNRLSNAEVEFKKLRENYNALVFQYQEVLKENERLKQQQIKTIPKPQYTPKPQPSKSNTPYNITKGIVETLRELSKFVMCKCVHNEYYNNTAYQDLFNYLSSVQVDENLKNEEFNYECYTYREDKAKQEGMKYEVHFAGELVKKSLKQIVENKDRCQQQEIVIKLEGYYKKLINK